MAGVHLSVDSRSVALLQERVFVMAAMDTQSLMPRLGEFLLHSTQSRFDSQTTPSGALWERLKHPSRKKYNEDKILTLRGMLRKNLHYQVANKSTVLVGSNAVYARTHQLGRGTIPARSFLGLSSTDRLEIESIITDWANDLGFG